MVNCRQFTGARETSETGFETLSALPLKQTEAHMPNHHTVSPESELQNAERPVRGPKGELYGHLAAVRH
jgi:hypothetical protein